MNMDFYTNFNRTKEWLERPEAVFNHQLYSQSSAHAHRPDRFSHINLEEVSEHKVTHQYSNSF